MRKVIASLLAAAFALTIAQAAEPEIPEQIPPANPQLQRLGKLGGGEWVYLEAKTIGRVGDTGFAWWLSIESGDDQPVWSRYIIDCTKKAYKGDWNVFLNPKTLAVASQGPGSRKWFPADDQITQDMVKYACTGQPLPGVIFNGVAAAQAAARNPLSAIKPGASNLPDTPAPPAAVPAAASNTFDFGPTVKIREASRRKGEGVYEGTWTRRGTSNIYDGSWVYLPNGSRFTDVMEMRGVNNGEVVVYRQGIKGTYTAPVLADGKLGRGKATWVSDPDYYWELVSAPVPVKTTTAVTFTPSGEHWVVGKLSIGALAFDRTSVTPEKDTGQTRASVVFYYKQPQQTNGKTWHFAHFLVAYACDKRTGAYRRTFFHDIDGKVVGDDYTPYAKLNPVDKDITLLAFFALACEHATIQKGTHVPGTRSDAFAYMKKLGG